MGVGASAMASADADDASKPIRPPECEAEADLELVAIVYVAKNPERSMALVGAERGSLVRVGQWLGNRQILDIEPRSIVLGPVGDACYVRLTDRSVRKPTPRRPKRRRRRR